MVYEIRPSFPGCIEVKPPITIYTMGVSESQRFRFAWLGEDFFT